MIIFNLSLEDRLNIISLVLISYYYYLYLITKYKILS